MPFLPPLTTPSSSHCLTGMQPLRPRIQALVSSRKLSLTLPTAPSPWPGEVLLLFAGRTLCIPPAPHLLQIIVIWGRLLFPWRKWTLQGKGPNCIHQHTAWDLAEYTVSNVFVFLGNICSWTLKQRQQMLSRWDLTQLFHVFWNPFSYWLPSYSQVDVRKLRGNDSKRPQRSLLIQEKL